MSDTSWTEERLLDLLEVKYGHEPAKRVFMRHVANGTGMAKERTIDGFAFEVWPSNDYITRAFEVKVSRSDFLGELSKPEKRRAWSQQVSEFWYVAPRGIVQVEELPDGCGLLVPRGSQLVRARPAATRDDAQMDTATVAALLRSASRELVSLRKQAQEYATLRGKPITLEALRNLVWAARKRRPAAEYMETLREVDRELRRRREIRKQCSKDLEEIVADLRKALDLRLPFPTRRLHPFAHLNQIASEVQRIRALVEGKGQIARDLSQTRKALRRALEVLDELSPEDEEAAA